MKKQMLHRLEAMERRRFGSTEAAKYLILVRANRHEEAELFARRMRIDLNSLSTEALLLFIDDASEKPMQTE
jgi:hypothetical protein